MITDALINAGVTPSFALEYLATFIPPWVFLYLLRKSGAGTEPQEQQASQEAYHTQDNYPHQQ